MSNEIVPGFIIINSNDDMSRELVAPPHQIVAVYFSSNPCRGCESIKGGLGQLPTKFPNVKYLQVPSTSNSKTHYCCSDVATYPIVKIYRAYSEPGNRNHIDYYIGAGMSEIETLIHQNL